MGDHAGLDIMSGRVEGKVATTMVVNDNKFRLFAVSLPVDAGSLLK
jgi:hypothetical protein